MARKRMFDNEIISQDSFIDLPKEAIALYFLLGMEADDEGFVAPKKVMRIYSISDDTLKILIAKNYIIPFKSGVVVITDWRRNNYLDKNRITPTIYQEEKELLQFDGKKNKYLLNACGSNVKQMLNECSTSIEENSIEEYRVEEKNAEEKIIAEITKCYEENIGLITPATAELLLDYLKDMDKELIIKAIKIASINNKRTGRYVQGILNDWSKKGIKTLLDVENEQQSYKNNKIVKKETLEEETERLRKEWGLSNED